MRPVSAFIGVHLLLAWLFWAGGIDFLERGWPMFWFAYLGIGLGGIAAWAAWDANRGK